MPYKPHLVTFFDILGFRNLIDTQKPKVISGILRKIRKHSNPDKELRKLYEISVISFSDSIVRAVHILSKSNAKYPVGILYCELIDLAFIQSLLIYEDGVFLRGAITAEKLYLSGKTVFGPGLVRAYELESKEAIYPRILVDDGLLELARNAKKFLGARHHDVETELKYIEAMTYLDQDGRRFVNYLGAAHNKIDGDLAFLNVLSMHFGRVAEKAKENAGNERVMNKYRWVATYHNAIINGYSEDFFEEYETSKVAFLLTDNQISGLSGWKMEGALL